MRRLLTPALCGILGHALVINGWGLADHSSLHPAEIAARENNRGFWRGTKGGSVNPLGIGY